MKIGIVDLDTSHPQNWIPIERELGHEIVGLWDGGSVHPKRLCGKVRSGAWRAARLCFAGGHGPRSGRRDHSRLQLEHACAQSAPLH